ncbi:hypothetical protein [Bacillus cereus]|uniref:hypothetical protein n=1 Tax=Bacillus cereus TaxID=1396 RepID=UPI0013D8370F|nr:hypothetical protein [Bacillus cereus]
MPLEQYNQVMNSHKSKVVVIVGYIEDEFTRADLKDSVWRQGMHANLGCSRDTCKNRS